MKKLTSEQALTLTGWLTVVAGLFLLGAWLYFALNHTSTADKEILCDMQHAKTSPYECRPSFLGSTGQK